MTDVKRIETKQFRRFVYSDRDPFAWVFVWGALAALLAIAVLGTLHFLGSRGIMSVEPFVYYTQYGYFYIYSFVSIFVCLLASIAREKAFSFSELRTNRCYYLTRMGFATSRIVFDRLLGLVLRVSTSYAFGIGCGFALGFAFGLDFILNGLLSVIFFGYVSVMLISFLSMGFDIVTRSRVGAVLLSVGATGLLAAFFYLSGCFDTSSRFTLSTRIASLMYLDGISYLLISGVLCVLMVLLAFVCARDRAAFYNSGQPKKAMLERMGIEKNSMVALVRGSQTETIVLGEKVKNKKERLRDDTLAVTLGTAQIDVSEKKAPTVGRIIISVVLFILCIAFYAFTAVGFVAGGAKDGKPAAMLGSYFVSVATNNDIEGFDEGDIAVFKACSASETSTGDTVLVKRGDGGVYGKREGVSDSKLTVVIDGAPTQVESSLVIGRFVDKPLFSSLLKAVAKTSLMIAADVLLTGLFLLALIIEQKKPRSLA